MTHKLCVAGIKDSFWVRVVSVCVCLLFFYLLFARSECVQAAVKNAVETPNSPDAVTAYQYATGWSIELLPNELPNIDIGDSIMVNLHTRNYLDGSKWKVPSNTYSKDTIGESLVYRTLENSGFYDINIKHSYIDFTATSSNPNVVSVDAYGSGGKSPYMKMKGEAPGTALVYVECSDYFECSYKYKFTEEDGTVSEKSATNVYYFISEALYVSVSVNQPVLVVTEQPSFITQDGYTYIINSSCNDKDYLKQFEWDVENTTICELSADANRCTVKGIGTGKTVLYCRTGDGQVVTIPVEVRKYVTKLSMSVDKSELNNIGEVATCNITMDPVDAYDKSVVWTSSNPAAVKVDANGKLTAQAYPFKDTVTITAQCGSQVATTRVKVDIAVTDFAFESESTFVTKGQYTYEVATVRPFGIKSGTTGSGVTFESADPSVAKINAVTGKIKGVAYGKTTVTAKFGDLVIIKDVVVRPKKTEILKTSKRAKKAMKLKLRDVSAATGYQIKICSSKTFKNAVTKDITRKTLKKKKGVWYIKCKNKMVYVKVRSYVKLSSGMKVYSAWGSVWRINKV